MPALKRVVQKRCERDGCDWYGVPVTVGDACAGCGSPLAVKTKLQIWIPLAAGGAVLVLVLPIFLLLRSHSRPPESSVTTASPPPTAARLLSPPPQTPAPQPSAIQEAALAVSRGERLASQGLYEDARREFLRATAEDPESSMAWANLGAAAAVTRHVDEARGAYEKALALAPDNWLTHYNLAVLLAREGDRDGAVGHLERFFALVGSREEKRGKAIDDLRRDPALRGLLDDPRVRDLAAQTGGRS